MVSTVGRRAAVGTGVGLHAGVGSTIVGGGRGLQDRDHRPDDGHGEEKLPVRLLLARLHAPPAYTRATTVSIVRLSLCTASVLTVLALDADASADPQPLAYRLDVDGAVTLASGAAWVTAISLRETIGPATCTLCGTNSFDIAARNTLLWKDPIAAERLVDVIGFGVGPAFILGADFLAASHEDSWRQSLVDALLIGEAAGIASDVNLAFRMSLGRERPWASVLPPDPTRTRDANMSFYSGHTTFLFAMATSAGTLATMRGYRWTPLVWLVGLPFAFATAYLRVASDDHWMSDVLVGVAAGTGMGVAIPWLAHKRVRIVPASGTVSLVGSF
jgi:membrane-associated phospholipid phosphatase